MIWYGYPNILVLVLVLILIPVLFPVPDCIFFIAA